MQKCAVALLLLAACSGAPAPAPLSTDPGQPPATQPPQPAVAAPLPSAAPAATVDAGAPVALAAATPSSPQDAGAPAIDAAPEAAPLEFGQAFSDGAVEATEHLLFEASMPAIDAAPEAAPPGPPPEALVECGVHTSRCYSQDAAHPFSSWYACPVGTPTPFMATHNGVPVGEVIFVDASGCAEL